MKKTHSADFNSLYDIDSESLANLLKQCDRLQWNAQVVGSLTHDDLADTQPTTKTNFQGFPASQYPQKNSFNPTCSTQEITGVLFGLDPNESPNIQSGTKGRATACASLL